MPGRGGIDRGPGPAPLRGSGNTRDDFGKFEGDSFRGHGDASEVPLGFGYAPPESSIDPEEAARDGTGEAMRFESGGERITWHSRLMPRHNDVLKKYFKKERKP